ncbi:MAG: glycoside hydrolase family 38 C-terminal domain-containing protein [Nitrososphaerota archaeon]|nr:glycoside hydrolase family 38 C-terminal domain-containing protein [Nitrososphaerota archaeon]
MGETFLGFRDGIRITVGSGLSIREIERRFIDFLASTFIDFRSIDSWIHGGVDTVLPYFTLVSPDDTLRFEKVLDIACIDGARWLLRLDITGNGLLIVDGEPYQGIDEQHRIAILEPGARHTVLEATSRRLFGETPWMFSFLASNLSAVLWDEFSLALTLIDLSYLAQNNKDLVPYLSRAASRIELTPSVSQIYALTRTLYGIMMIEGLPEHRPLRWDVRYVASVYGEKVIEGALDDTAKPCVGEVRETGRMVVEALNDILVDESRSGRIYLFAHSHIDTAWLWPFSETRRKILRTFSTIARLANLGYRFTYVQSGAQNYRWLEDDHKLFSTVKKLVGEGLWLPVGGMWVESDTQLISGESLARQFLYGQRYFEEKFGRRCRIGWLPDSFGFSAQLPQVMSKSGIEVFVTHKVMWNDTNEFPYHAFLWEGLDGTRIIGHIIVASYNGVATSSELYGMWGRYKQRDRAPAIYSYGYGDGGGGPTFAMLERLKILKKLKILPELIEAPSEDEYIEALRRVRDSLPVWRGEIYNEYHRGVYTTNIRVKQLMSRAESEALWAETLSTVTGILGLTVYMDVEVRDAWERILRCQFHDVLPGSSNREAYEEAYQDLDRAMTGLSRIAEASLKSLAENIYARKGCIIVFNRLPWMVRAILELPRRFYETYDGIPIDTQILDDRSIALIDVPPLGYTTLIPVEEGSTKGGVMVEELSNRVVIENEYLKVEVTREGYIVSIYDKELGEEFLAGLSNVIEVHTDKPGSFDAWDVERVAVETPGVKPDVVGGVEVVMRGPVAARVRSRYRYRDSVIEQYITVYKGSRLIMIDTMLDWREKNRLVKVWFKPNVKSEDAYFEVPFGVVKRSAIVKDSWDEARFEVPALRWVDISDGRKGFAVISTDRHGYTVREGRVGLSLLKSPLMPNPWSDLGLSKTTYYVYPHLGDYRIGEVYRRAYEVWSGVRWVIKDSDGGSLPSRYSLMEIPRGVIVECIKFSEDNRGVIIRLYEVEGEERTVELKLPGYFDVYESNLLERIVEKIASDTDTVDLRFKPFEIKTILLSKTSRC